MPARALERERAEGANAAALNVFFDMYEKLHSRFNFPPSLIANFDESMIKFKETKHKVIAPREVTKAYFRMAPHVEHITLGAAIFADGSHLKPLLIIQKNNLPADMVALVVQEKWCVAGGDTAWITKAVFSQWALGPFVQDITRRRQELGKHDAPALLIVDGHGSRADPDTMQKLRDNHNIHVVTLVSHSTHCLQPLDVNVLGCFKGQLQKSGRDRRAAFAKAAPERRAHLMEMVLKAWYHACEPSIVRRGWEKSGLWPVKREIPLQHEAVNHSFVPDLRPNRDLEAPAGDGIEADEAADDAPRFNISGRLLTSELAIGEMRAFQEQQKKKEEEKEARKAEREKRKAERELEAEERKKRKAEKEQLRQAKAVEKELKKKAKEKEKEDRIREKEKKQREKEERKLLAAQKKRKAEDEEEHETNPTPPAARPEGKRVPRVSVLLSNFN